MECPLCTREAPDNRISDHHLIPKSRGGGPQDTVPICIDCHNGVHAFFTNKELEKEYNTVDALLADEKFAKHTKWLSKQDISKRHRSKRAKDKKRRGRAG